MHSIHLLAVVVLSSAAWAQVTVLVPGADRSTQDAIGDLGSGDTIRLPPATFFECSNDSRKDRLIDSIGGTGFNTSDGREASFLP